MRQHVNPLGQKYQVATPAPDWADIYANPLQPLHLDIGCARGQFLLAMAQQFPNWNFIGVEIRAPLVRSANQTRNELGLTNLHYLFCNISTSLESLFAPASLKGVSIQFPDPWFKRRHQKRRVVQSDFLDAVARCLAPEGFLFIQSDVLAIAQQMRDRITAHPRFVPTTPDHTWMETNPFGVSTEREAYTLEQNRPVYRCWFERA